MVKKITRKIINKEEKMTLEISNFLKQGKDWENCVAPKESIFLKHKSDMTTANKWKREKVQEATLTVEGVIIPGSKLNA